jgi:hypothetical protein
MNRCENGHDNGSREPNAVKAAGPVLLGEGSNNALPLTRIYPDLQILTRGLTSVFRSNGYTDGQVTVCDRKPTSKGTFGSEIVRCQLSDGRELHVVCKYGAGHSVNVYGHRGGVPYEAAVYRHVLQPRQAAVPTYYGAYTDTTTGKTLLVLDYLHKSHWPRSAAKQILAARWIGQFHAANEAWVVGNPVPFMNTYQAPYYCGWVRRTSEFAGHAHQCFPWLATLCERGEEFATPLLESPSTIIHGEYYSVNILRSGGNIYPVDWESAAIAAGEIDLACLTDGWPGEIVQQCELEYQEARWPHGSPTAFEWRLAAARLYVHFRWLGDRPEWTVHKYRWRFEHLRSAGERLGLI